MPMYKIVLRHSVDNLQTIQALQKRDVPIYYGLSPDDQGIRWMTVEYLSNVPNPTMVIRKYRNKPNWCTNRMVGYQTFQQLMLVPNEAVLTLFMEIAKN